MRGAVLWRPISADARPDGGGIFVDITLPIIAPALVSGWLLAFTLSLDDLVIASFVTGPGASTLPIVIFSKVKLGVSPEVNALATLVMGVSATALLISQWLNREQQVP